MASGLTLILTSPRSAVGLLTWAAWDSLRQADRVLAAADADPDLVEALAQAEVTLQAPVSADPHALARELVDAAREETVVWLGSADGDPGLTDGLADELSRVALGAEPPTVEIVVGSHDVPGARLLDLVAVMDRLRSPGGCPWDAAQTPQTLTPYLLEEAYEAVEAIESGDRAAMVEELGDVLLQVVFHARVGEEDPDEPFDIDEVAAGIVAKLVRRHPHVFAEPEPGADPASSPQEVERRWDEIKASEKDRGSALDGIPAGLPALARADAVLARAGRAGLTPLTDPAPTGQDGSQRQFGDELLALVRQARHEGVDPEAALRAAVRRVEQELRATEGAR